MGGRRKGGSRRLAGTIVATALALLGANVAAAAASGFCQYGEGPGQCKGPHGVAVDFETDRVYVADEENDRINVFEVSAGGEVEFKFAFGESGTGDGKLNAPRGLAVDNDPGSEGHHRIYVYDSGNQRVQSFDPEGNYVAKAGPFETGGPLAVGPGGDVYVADTLGDSTSGYEPRLKRFNAKLEATGECEATPRAKRINRGLAVDGAGALYSTFDSTTGVVKLEWAEPQCEEVGGNFPLHESSSPDQLTVDAADDLYTQEASGGFGRAITKFDAAGNVLRSFAYGELETNVAGIAALPSPGGDVFASEHGLSFNRENDEVKYLSEPPPGPVPGQLKATPGNASAVLEAQINPEGEATEYQFEYLTQAEYEEAGETFAGARKAPAAKATLEGEGFSLVEATALAGCEEASEEAIEAGECLTPETEYRYRVLFDNVDGSGSEEGTFTTLPPLTVEAWAQEVGSDTARLVARVDPLGIPAEGYLEYVEDALYQESGFAEATRVPAAGAGQLDFGAGTGAVRRSVAVELSPGTVYHLRAQASDALIEAPVASAESVFRTFAAEALEPGCPNDAFRGGPSALLPDCRAYELVSPIEKEGGDILTLPELAQPLPTVLNQSAAGGDRLAYGSYRAFGDAQAAPLTAQYIAARGAAEWTSHYILGPREELAAKSGQGLFTELKALSDDLCEGWIRTVAEPKLAPGAVAGQSNLYRRGDGECGPESYEALSTAPAPHPETTLALEVQGRSTDGETTLYAAKDNLTAKAPDSEGKEFGLYLQEAGEGAPTFVCILPDNLTAASGGCAAGTTPNNNGGMREASVTNALSGDGSRVYWSTKGGEGPGRIYLRINPAAPPSFISEGKCTQPTRACTVAVSEAAEEDEGTSASQFWGAAEDGSEALFTTGGTLYRFAEETGEASPIAEAALGVMGASEDLSRVYFASEEALGGENPLGETAQPGEANLYLEEEGAIRFVAALVKSSDVTSRYAAINAEPIKRTARVSADGGAAVFMSTGRPTGYDNADAASGEAATEVFVYRAEASGGEGQLACASCNPSGGRPAAQSVKRGTANYLAAGMMPVWPNTLYQGRFLAEDGERAFFEAVDALAPRDTNGKIDVYQWEAVGKGSCEEESPSYSPVNEGCVSLISSGKGAGDAGFADASASGDDVFFTTAAGLVPHDRNLVDLYDARVEGGLPAPAAPAAECEGEACRSPAPAPAASPPASLLYRGPGDLRAEKKAKKKRCAKGRHKVRRKGRVRCVKNEGKRHRRHARQRRAERGARR